MRTTVSASCGDLLAVGRRRDVHRDVIAGRRRAVERHQLAVAGEHLLELLRHVVVGELADQPLELEALPLGHVELGPHLDRELKRHRPVVGHLDRVEIEIRLADRRERLVVADLAQAVHEQRALDLVRDFFLVAMLDDLPRRAADAEAGDRRGRHQLAVGVVVVAIDVVARNRNRHAALARAGALDVDFQIERRHVIGSTFALRFDRHARRRILLDLVAHFVLRPFRGHLLHSQKQIGPRPRQASAGQ